MNRNLTLIINLDEDENYSDMEDEETLRRKAIHSTNTQIENKMKESDEFKEEICKLKSIIADASKYVHPIKEQLQYCGELTLNVHNKETIPKSHKNTGVLIPFYDSKVHFNAIQWVNTPEYERAFMFEKNPAKWISEDYNPALGLVETGEDLEDFFHTKISTWKLDLNAKLNRFVLEDTEFIIWEVSYLRDPVSGDRGLTGMTFLKCTQKKTVVVDDICTIKISTNHRNTAHGDLAVFLNKNYTDIPIYLYTPDNSDMQRVFSSTLFPWSGVIYMNRGRIYNLVRYLGLGKSNDHSKMLQNLCLDKETHSSACSTCNGINLLYKLSNGDCTIHYNPKIHLLLPTELDYIPTIYKTLVCKYVRYLEYSDVIGSQLYEHCRCYKLKTKRKLSITEDSNKRTKN